MPENEVDIKFISSHLGHSSIGITCDTYLAVTNESKRKVANKMDELFNNDDLVPR